MLTHVYQAPAKLNLTLHITGKRDNGFHEIESLAVFTALGDTVEVTPADNLLLDVKGPFAAALQNNIEDNLVMRAAKLLQKFAGGAGAHVTLTKNLPIGAGLGGGSSDAAAAIKALMQHWKLELTNTELHNIALALGSDVPVCLVQEPALISGIGDRVMPCELTIPLWAVLCNPRVELLTADVYKGFAQAFSKPSAPPAKINNSHGFQDYLYGKRNMLEVPAIEILPVLKEIKQAIALTEGCVHALMSGSGATCFGLYETKQAAQKAHDTLKSTYPDYWVMCSAIQPSE